MVLLPQISPFVCPLHWIPRRNYGLIYNRIMICGVPPEPRNGEDAFTKSQLNFHSLKICRPGFSKVLTRARYLIFLRSKYPLDGSWWGFGETVGLGVCGDEAGFQVLEGNFCRHFVFLLSSWSSWWGGRCRFRVWKN